MSFDYKELIGKLIEENSNLKKQLEELVLKVPSKYLTNTAEFNGETHPDVKHTAWDDIGEPTYIYESPDGGKTLYRREAGDYDNKEQVDSDGNPLPTQMELF
tara:strand:+ start:204 stop:509 length:306 start_codon:yes stop_codon:yes gene_type:complete